MHQYLRFTYRKVGGGHWSHFQVLFQVSGGPKMAIFMAKTRPTWRGCSRLDWPTWKVYSAPYHTPMHGRAWLRTIFAHSRHLSRVPGVQMAKMTIFRHGRQGSPRVSKVRGGPQGWVRWVITRSIIFKSFSYTIFKIGQFPHWNPPKSPLKTKSDRPHPVMGL